MTCTGSTAQDTITNIGDTRQVVVNVVDCDGEPVNVSAYNLTYTLSLSAGGDALLTKTESDGITVAVDEVTILLDAADTVLTSRKYHHELVIDDGTVFQTVMIGKHLFTHGQVSCCDALSATMNTVIFTGAVYMLDFSKVRNSNYISLF